MVQALKQEQRPHNAPTSFVARYLEQQANHGLRQDKKQDHRAVDSGLEAYFESIGRERPRSTPPSAFDVTKFKNWKDQVATNNGAEDRLTITL